VAQLRAFGLACGAARVDDQRGVVGRRRKHCR
jgi:hypothetical protein